MPRPGARFRPVFTPAGFAAAAIALFILVQSLVFRNAYEIVLSAALLCFLLICFIAGTLGAGRFAGLSPLWTVPAPLGANAAEETAVAGLDLPVPWFFRLHFVVRGRFFPGGSADGCRWSAETSAAPGGGPARLTINFPMSGIFLGESSCRLRDLFGFFSFPCGIPGSRALTIRSAPCSGNSFRIEAHSGAEDRRNKSADDQERYYMREYAPGDRFRDINWKSSGRIDTLITRISPDTQEKVNRIEVRFRNYGPSGGPPWASLEELWLLDRAKAQLARFLRSVQAEQAKYVLHVRAAEGAWDIYHEDDLEKFLDELAGLSFSPVRQEGAADAPAGGGRENLYVFSTPCDSGLTAFLMNATRPVFLFLCRPVPPGTLPGEVETLHLRDFPLGGFAPPFRWLKARRAPSRGFANPPLVSGGRILPGYAEARW
ncbi:MAG: DUF58 domain-containing protein [Treponema sp.]|jgi:hypothetical protein|nr:DUF58 domain-containing protein [Treponema sp.]